MKRILIDKVENILGWKKSADRFEGCQYKSGYQKRKGKMEKGWEGAQKEKIVLFLTTYCIVLEDVQASVLPSTKMIYA